MQNTNDSMKSTSGFVFISNPRLTSRHPDNRLDDDIRDAQLKKLTEAFNHANQNNLTVVMLGKLFDRHRESDPKLLIGLFTLLSNAKHKPICLANSDDLDGVKLTKDTSLSLVNSTGLINVVTEHGLVDVFDVEGVKVGLGASPFGQPSESDAEWEVAIDKSIWLAHDPFQPKSIDGIDIVINGYSIAEKPLIKTDDTDYAYPGSISRLSSDERLNTPAAYQWTNEGLTQYPLEHLANLYIDPDQMDDSYLSQDSTSEIGHSLFIDSMKTEMDDELDDTASAFNHEILSLMENTHLSSDAKAIINDLIKRATDSVGMPDEVEEEFRSAMG